MPTMSWLTTRLLATLCAQALGRTHKPIGGGRQTAVMAIFGLLPLQGVDALLQRLDQPFEDVHTLLPSANGDDGLFEPLAQVLIRLVRLFQLFVFAPQRFIQGRLLGSQLVQFFVFRHAATLADCPSFRNCIALLNSYSVEESTAKQPGCLPSKEVFRGDPVLLRREGGCATPAHGPRPGCDSWRPVWPGRA